MEITFTFNGDPVPASRPRVTRFGTFNSERYHRYKRDLSLALNAKFGALQLSEPLTLSATFYRATKRRFDLDNAIKSVCDALQDAKVIDDDSWIYQLKTINKAYDKANPRVEFSLERYEVE